MPSAPLWEIKWKRKIAKLPKVKSIQQYVRPYLLYCMICNAGPTSSLGISWTFSVACFSDTKASSKVKLAFPLILQLQILCRYKFIRFKYILDNNKIKEKQTNAWLQRKERTMRKRKAGITYNPLYVTNLHKNITKKMS